MQCVENCDDPNPRHHVLYEQPVWQTLQMFRTSPRNAVVGITTNIALVLLLRSYRDFIRHSRRDAMYVYYRSSLAMRLSHSPCHMTLPPYLGCIVTARNHHP